MLKILILNVIKTVNRIKQITNKKSPQYAFLLIKTPSYLHIMIWKRYIKYLLTVTKNYINFIKIIYIMLFFT